MPRIIAGITICILTSFPIIQAAEKTGTPEESTAPEPKESNTNEENKSTEKAEPTGEEKKADKAAKMAYIMAGNRVRQGRYKDGLRYYMEALASDPDFTEAMADAAMLYKHFGDYDRAEAMIKRAINIFPEEPDLHHILGAIHQDWGMEMLRQDKLQDGGDHIHAAVKAYGKAIELSQNQGRLGERAGTYFRLGEICYLAHADPEGAREYWRKVMRLHTPTPDLSEEYEDYRRHTYLKVKLHTWQEWAANYLRQLDIIMAGPNPQAAPGTDTGEGKTTVPEVNPETAP